MAAIVNRRVLRRWHRFGPVKFYVGTHGKYGYGWHWFKGHKGSRDAAFGKVFVIWKGRR